MNDVLKEMVERVSIYRERFGLTERQLAEQFGVSPSQFSNYGNGRNSITFKRLLHFYQNGGDVSYILTGEWRKSGIVEVYLEQCKDSESKRLLLRYMIVLLSQGCRMCETEVQKEKLLSYLKKAEKYVNFSEEENTDWTVWKNIRKVERLSQSQMSELLEVDRRTYGLIERNEGNPGANVLLALYHNMDYSPLIIIDCEAYYANEINTVWGRLPKRI